MSNTNKAKCKHPVTQLFWKGNKLYCKCGDIMRDLDQKRGYTNNVKEIQNQRLETKNSVCDNHE